MLESTEYSLLDFGAGRKLERFGEQITDRPCPAAVNATLVAKTEWRQASGKYVRITADQGRWQPADGLPPEWH